MIFDLFWHTLWVQNRAIVSNITINEKKIKENERLACATAEYGAVDSSDFVERASCPEGGGAPQIEK